ncbi:MAG: hypothetical protein AABX66_01815 [Nanoarchaeota archaeon]
MEVKGQLKIQEMAFVLVAIVIFLGLVALIFFSIRLNNIKNEAATLKEEQAAALVRHISGLPELSWDCPGCIDLDKAIALKNSKDISLNNFLELDYLMIEILYPLQKKGNCVIGNYPDCSQILLINDTKDFGVASSAFVTLCRWQSDKQQEVCALGKVYAAGKGVSR